MLKRALALSIVVVGCQDGGQMESLPEVSGETIERHLRTLSADEYGGRSPGTEGGDAAARYIADRFQEAGLEPVDGSYFQAVPIIGSTPDPASASVTTCHTAT